MKQDAHRTTSSACGARTRATAMPPSAALFR
jgi:hypothetical protein